MPAERIRICTVTDHPDDPKKQRSCFWPDALKPWIEGGVQDRCVVWTPVFLPDTVDWSEYVDFETYDVVIFNWDVLNGDPMFRSDRSQQMARHYARDLREFVRGGGLVIMECQAALFSPSQAAYDSVTQEAGLPRLRVTDSTTVSFGFSVRPETSLLGRHPFLPVELGRWISAEDCDWNSREPWFPTSAVSLRTLQAFEGTHHRMYSGGFERASLRHWRPILYAEDGQHPVACVYHEPGEGAYLVTTMYLAASNVSGLLRPITLDWRDSLSALNA